MQIQAPALLVIHNDPNTRHTPSEIVDSAIARLRELVAEAESSSRPRARRLFTLVDSFASHMAQYRTPGVTAEQVRAHALSHATDFGIVVSSEVLELALPALFRLGIFVSAFPCGEKPFSSQDYILTVPPGFRDTALALIAALETATQETPS